MKIKGTGLGLNICKEIMENQNGEFLIKSNLDEGCKAMVIFHLNKIKELKDEKSF